MGLYDTVKAKAGELAADAERAGRVAAAQARVVTLQSDVRKAERELGQTAYSLVELGELRHPDLDAAAAALRAAREALVDKEDEIATLRGEAASPQPAAGTTTASDEPSDGPADGPAPSPPGADEAPHTDG